MSTIRILVTGGTFDKEYDELTGRLYFKDTHVPEMLRRGRCRLDVTVDTVMMVDSLDLDDRGRAEIVRRCRQSAETCIVITHGTDTMVETARALASANLHRKTMILTGAMVPYAFGSSDGLFNLGSALTFAQVLPPGVYVAMNGQHFAWNNVRKDNAMGVFEPLAIGETRTRRKSAPGPQQAAREDKNVRRKNAPGPQQAAREDKNVRRKNAPGPQQAAREDKGAAREDNEGRRKSAPWLQQAAREDKEDKK